jgi:hypothetical protein
MVSDTDTPKSSPGKNTEGNVPIVLPTFANFKYVILW